MASIVESIRLNGTSNSPRPLLRLPSRSTLLFLGLSLLWYSCSFLSASTSKALLSGRKNKAHPASYDGASSGNGTTPIHNAATTATIATTYKAPPLFPYPVSLTALQFAFVFTFSYTLCSPTIARYIYKWMGRPSPRDPDTGRARGLMSTLIVLDGAKLREMIGLSMFSVTGHAMTSAAIQLVPVSTVHTIKALSPLFTVLSYVFILHLSYPLKTYISLAPLTLGVILACSGLSSIEGPKAWVGVLLSIGSTIVFVAQNLWSKKLLGHALSGAAPAAGSGGSGIKLDKLNLLLWSSGVSFLFTIPMVLYSDLPKLRLHSGHSISHASGFNVDLRNGTGAGTLQTLTPRGISSLPAPSTTWRTIELLVSNGSVHFAQSLLAFSILGLTSPVTYSIASLFKRVFVICFAIIWFGQTVSSVQWMGIVMTFIGLYLYNDSKQKPSSGEGKGFSLSQSMASREDEAAQDFGMEKSSRRRAGLLPTSASAAAQNLPGAGAGPIWKGMSSSLMAGANANGHAVGEAKNGPKRD